VERVVLSDRLRRIDLLTHRYQGSMRASASPTSKEHPMDGSPATTLTALVRLDRGPELEPEVAERLTRQLRAELLELDVESVRPVPAGPPPDGAKAADAVTVGAVVVAFSASGGVLTTLVSALREWLARHSTGHRLVVTIDGDTIELDGATSTQQRDLVGAYLRRHGEE
jgi:hypothetical protein